MEEDSVLVLELGSGFSRFGFGGEDSPRSVFPSVVGRPRYYKYYPSLGQKQAYVGDEVFSKEVKPAMESIHYPIDGAMTNWDDYEKILHHGIYN